MIIFIKWLHQLSCLWAYSPTNASGNDKRRLKYCSKTNKFRVCSFDLFITRLIILSHIVISLSQLL